jgi:N-acetylmuramic acid 6-phosphate etherase
MPNEVFDEIKALITEARNSNTKEIDNESTFEIVRLINQEDQKVAQIVAGELLHIAAAVDIIVEALRQGGRLYYIGAGTSGRLGVLDASECPPTYGTDPEMVQAIIAGGYKALVRSQEGAEDIAEHGARDLMERGFTSKDVLCGIAASQRTPYVLGAIEKAKTLGAKVIYVFCNPRQNQSFSVDVAICPVVGPEVIMGSTRMKAGTATKMVLNMLTTATMIRLGKVYQNFMVDLQMTSRKLEERSKRMVMLVTGVDYERAEQALALAGGHVKTALVMILAGVDAAGASHRLSAANGFVRAAITQ